MKYPSIIRVNVDHSSWQTMACTGVSRTSLTRALLEIIPLKVPYVGFALRRMGYDSV
jgi:hypothetical protein